MSAATEITVTMLGTSGSGKTTYLLGMYAALSGGQDGFFLHSDDDDLDLELSENWEALADEGVVPPPTADTPKSYPFAFRTGFTRLVTVDWLDYRGGAMTDRSGAADSAQLIDRLARSDSIYLTLDGELLQNGVDERNSAVIRRGTKAERMTRFVQGAAEKRGRIPSLVVLMTKFDLIARATPGGGAAAVKRAVDAARLILPIAFEPGVTALVCPVSLGDIGTPIDDRIDPDRVAPRWVHKPMLFSMQQAQALARAESASLARAAHAREQEKGFELAALQSNFFSIFKSGQIQALAGERIGAEHDAAKQRHMEEQAHRQARRLADEFRDLPIFVDGQRVETIDA
jgi:hypothetical protein